MTVRSYCISGGGVVDEPAAHAIWLEAALKLGIDIARVRQKPFDLGLRVRCRSTGATAR